MKKPLVLVIDDNIDNISVLEELLKEYDYDFNSITESTIVLDVLEYQTPDLILLDYFMPEQDGLETLKIIKSYPQYKSIPVIILTADTENETLVKFFKEGASDFLHKPINHIELKARIESSLKIANLNKQLRHKLSIVKKQNDEIDMYTNLIYNELNGPLQNIARYSKMLENTDEMNLEKVRELSAYIRNSQEKMSFQINNMIDVIGIMKGKDLKQI